MKLSKDELKNKLSELITDNEILVQILEDIEDSFEEVTEIDTTENVELQAKYDELLEKYKNRFLNSGDETVTEGTEETKEETKDEIDEEEEKIIDINEI